MESLFQTQKLSLERQKFDLNNHKVTGTGPHRELGVVNDDKICTKWFSKNIKDLLSISGMALSNVSLRCYIMQRLCTVGWATGSRPRRSCCQLLRRKEAVEEEI